MRAVVSLLCVLACVRTETVQCEEGICPAGSLCRRLPSFGDQIRCTTQGDVDACDGKTQLEGCEGPLEVPTRRCYDGACLETGCGNAIVDPQETCDDGNQIDEPAGDPGACSSDCSSRLTCGDGVVDLDIGETCDDATGNGGFGATVARDGCTACTLDELEWITEPHEPGEVEAIAVMAYDAHRDRTVLLAQTHQEVSGGSFVLVWGTWEWDGVRWTRQTPRVQPFPAQGMAMVYDHARRRVVVFGGALINAQRTNAEWEWDGARWAELTPVVRPSPRQEAVLTYDARRERIILVGGGDGTKIFDDIWARNNLGEWQQLATPAGFTPRSGASATYDPVRDVIVVFGGWSGGGALQDTWELSATGWTQIMPTPSPSGRTRALMAFDPVAREVLLYAGARSVAYVEEHAFDTWRWNGTRWQQIGSTPTIEDGDVGDDEAVPAAQTRAGLLAVRDVTTVLLPSGASSWTNLRTAAERPISSNAGWAAAVDMAGGRILLVGDGAPTAQAWLWSGADWTRLGGTLPSPRIAASLAFDSRHREFVLFGGRYFPTAGPPSFRTDTWIFDDSLTWSVETISTGPSGRESAAMHYDPIDNAVIMFGGNPLSSETWRYDGGWQPLASPSPPPTYGAASAAAAPGEGLLLFGGSSVDTRVWRWRQGTWTPDGGGGATRTYPAAAYDAARGQFIVQGGAATTSVIFDQTDQWRDGTWSAAPSTARTQQHVMVSALDGHGVIEMSGFGRPFRMRQLRTRVSAISETCGAHDDDGDGLVGCTDPDCWTICTPHCPPGSDRNAAVCAIGCGDGTCNAARESCRTCPNDCGACPTLCGDFICDTSENASTCPGDCP